MYNNHKYYRNYCKRNDRRDYHRAYDRHHHRHNPDHNLYCNYCKRNDLDFPIHKQHQPDDSHLGHCQCTGKPNHCGFYDIRSDYTCDYHNDSRRLVAEADGGCRPERQSRLL